MKNPKLRLCEVRCTRQTLVRGTGYSKRRIFRVCFALSQELKKQINEQNKKAGTVLCLLVPCLGKVFIHMHSRGSPFYHPPAQPSTSFLTLFDARVGSFRSSKLDSLSTSQGLTERERARALLLQFATQRHESKSCCLWPQCCCREGFPVSLGKLQSIISQE